MYKPLSISSKVAPTYTNSMLARNGMNLEDNPQVMDIKYATVVRNYIPYRYGLEKRKGKTAIFARVGANPITMLKEFMSGVWVFGYSTIVEAYNTYTGVFTTIKNDFSVNNGFCGERYGDFFFVCNGVEKIWRISNALIATEIPNSPICAGIKIIGNRLYAFNLSTDPSSIKYSEVDDGSDPPFDSWAVTTAADTAGSVNYRNAGAIRSVCQLGQYTVAFSDNGFFAFYINTVESAGTMKKIEVIQNYTSDYGGARGAIETPLGVFYINEAGLWQLVAVGDTNSPMSKQQVKTSELLGGKYFKGIDQTKVDLVYDINQGCIFATLAKDSETNNLVIGYKIDMKAMFEITNWNISRFAKIGEDIYGASSVKTTVYKLFDGYDDDGLSIPTSYVQEIPLNTLYHAHSLLGFYSGGFFSPSTEVDIRFDTHKLNGDIVVGKTEYKWLANITSMDYDEWGSASWSNSAWGGDFDKAGLVECFAGGSPRIENLQRLILNINGGDKYRHVLSWLALKTIVKQPIRRRNLIKNY